MKIRHPHIDWRGATPIAAAFSDIYYSPEDAVGEVCHNFVSRVQPMMGKRETILIGETGFGTGLNFLVTWQEWLRHRRAGDRLIFVSTEAYPLRVEDLRRALSPFPELKALTDQLINVWPAGIPGPHRRFFDVGEERGKVELWVLYGDALTELKRQNFQADAWYFDGFNPSENPALWSPKVIAECARLMAPGAVAGTFTVAGAVRRAMDAVGLKTEKHPGFGRKRECLRIEMEGIVEARNSLLPVSPHVLGDGVAAAGICHAANQRGISITYERGDSAHRASGNPAALVNFKPTKAPYEPSNRMLAACLAQVQPIYDDLWLEGRGTHKPARNAEELAEFEACLAAMGWSDEALEVRTFPGLDQGLFSWLAGYVRPDAVLRRLFDSAKITEKPEGATPICALGFGTTHHSVSLSKALRRNIGQVDAFNANECTDVSAPVTYGGYMTPRFAGQVLAGSTYDRDPDWTDPTLWDSTQMATDQIVEKAAKAGLVLPKQAQESYVSARAFGKDHRPIVGQTGEEVWVLTGLGSRGFLTAPLLAEILLDEMEGRESAGLPTYDFKDCVHPGRFVK